MNIQTMESKRLKRQMLTTPKYVEWHWLRYNTISAMDAHRAGRTYGKWVGYDTFYGE